MVQDRAIRLFLGVHRITPPPPLLLAVRGNVDIDRFKRIRKTHFNNKHGLTLEPSYGNGRPYRTTKKVFRWDRSICGERSWSLHMKSIL